MDQASKLLTERTLRQKTEKQSFFLFIFFFAQSLCCAEGEHRNSAGKFEAFVCSDLERGRTLRYRGPRYFKNLALAHIHAKLHQHV